MLRQTPSRVDLLTDRYDRTDVAILSIPVPLLWKVKLPLGRKIAIGVLLCSGVFIIIATLLRCILSLQSIQGINISTIWAIRETVSRHYTPPTSVRLCPHVVSNLTGPSSSESSPSTPPPSNPSSARADGSPPARAIAAGPSSPTARTATRSSPSAAPARSRRATIPSTTTAAGPTTTPTSTTRARRTSSSRT